MLIDTTLREGEQLFGAYYDPPLRRRILLHLSEAGVEEAEAGCVGRDGLAELLVWARVALPGLRLGVWAPCRKDCLAQAALLGAHIINVGVPVSDLHLTRRLGWTRAHALSRIERILDAAAELGVPTVSFGLEDASRADPEFVATAAKTAARHGAMRVRIADTVGHFGALETARLVAGVRRALDAENPVVRLAVHCHDDFGMATANALAALESGADQADVSLLGVGERAGVASTEELAAYLALRRRAARYDISVLRRACLLVASAAKVEVARTKAVVGRDIFRCESGLHVHGLGKDPNLFEPYPPEAVGARRELALGGKSGKAAVRELARRLGLEVEESQLPEAAERIRRAASALGRPLRPEELPGLLSGKSANLPTGFLAAPADVSEASSRKRSGGCRSAE
ncbi:MAG: LeuA family protein [Desulfovibrio sp.]